MSFGWAVYLQVLHPQGKNPLGLRMETSAVGDMLLLGIPNIIPWHPEDQNDLAQLEFLGIAGVPASTSQTMVASGSKPDPHGPCPPEQWAKLQKMVAWLSFSL